MHTQPDYCNMSAKLISMCCAAAAEWAATGRE